MKNRAIILLGLVSGILLIVAVALFPLAIPLEPKPLLATAKLLAERQTVSVAYVIAIVLSNICFLPLPVLLSIRLYRLRPGTAVVAGSVLVLAVLLETVAVLLSLARWNWVILSAAEGDPSALKLLETFQLLWLAVDLPGALLFYVGAAIYALGLWRIQRGASLIMANTVILVCAAGVFSAVSPSIGGWLTAGSIALYGLGYVALAWVAVQLGRDPGFHPGYEPGLAMSPAR